jgi:hypothetical protein
MEAFIILLENVNLERFSLALVLSDCPLNYVNKLPLITTAGFEYYSPSRAARFGAPPF